MRRRLKVYYQRQRHMAFNSKMYQLRKTVMSTADQLYEPHLLVVDFECTCEENVYKYDHEIIEFPVIVVDTKLKRVVGWMLFSK